MPSVNLLKGSQFTHEVVKITFANQKFPNITIPKLVPKGRIVPSCFYHLHQSSCEPLLMRHRRTGSFWNVNLKGTECKTLHDWAGYRDFTWKNQTLFQAFPGSLSSADDIQGSSEAPLPNPHWRSANLLTFCHSHMQRTEPTPAHRLRRVQKADNTLSQQKDKIDFNEMNLFLHSLSFICEWFLSWGFSVSLRLSLISFSSAARKNTACSHIKWKCIYITRPLKGLKTQLPAKRNQARCGWATCKVLRIGEEESNSAGQNNDVVVMDLPLKQNFNLCFFLLIQEYGHAHCVVVWNENWMLQTHYECTINYFLLTLYVF